MTCEQFLALLDREGSIAGELGAEHLVGCRSCSAALERWRAVEAEFSAMAQEGPPPFLHARVVAHVRGATAGRDGLPWWRPLWVAPALAVALVVALGGVGLWRQLAPKPVLESVSVPDQANAGDKVVVAEPGTMGKAERSVVETVSPPPQARPQRPSKKVAIAPVAASPVVTEVPAAPFLEAQARESVAASSGEAETEAVPQAGMARAEGRARSGAAASMAKAPSSVRHAAAPQGLVDCLVRTEGGEPVAEFATGEDDAPPAGNPWLVVVTPDGALELGGPEARTADRLARLERALRSFRLPAGRYLISRKSG